LISFQIISLPLNIITMKTSFPDLRVPGRSRENVFRSMENPRRNYLKDCPP
jgi:hypothetical protein